MTRKDYVAIAAALAAVRCKGGTESALQYQTQSDIDAGAIADVMARDNPRFDRARFLKAAGVQS